MLLAKQNRKSSKVPKRPGGKWALCLSCLDDVLGSFEGGGLFPLQAGGE